VFGEMMYKSGMEPPNPQSLFQQPARKPESQTSTFSSFYSFAIISPYHFHHIDSGSTPMRSSILPFVVSLLAITQAVPIAQGDLPIGTHS
jgi:hypothetical protein